MSRERINLDDLLNNDVTPITLNGKEYSIYPPGGDVWESVGEAASAGAFGFKEMLLVVEKCVRPALSAEEVKALPLPQLTYIANAAVSSIRQVEDQIVPLSSGVESQEVTENQAEPTEA